MTQPEMEPSMDIQIPNPIGSLNCPDCDEAMELSESGAVAYMSHWVQSHGTIADAPTEGHRLDVTPEVRASVRVFKADGSIIEQKVT